MTSPSALRTLLAGGATVIALMATGCARGDDPGGPDPAQLVPAEAPIFIDAVLRPTEDVGDGAATAIETLTGNADPGGFIVSQLDDLLVNQDAGITYEQDIEPWLGERGGLYISELSSATDPDFTLMFGVTDQDAAQEAVDRLSEVDDAPQTQETYEGVSFTLNSEDSAVGFVEEFLVIGNRAGFEATVDAAAGDDLAADPDFVELTDLADPDRLITLYVQVPTLLAELADSGGIEDADIDPLLGLFPADQTGATLAWAAAEADQVSLELVGAAGEDGAPAQADPLEGLPDDAWLAVSAGEVGATISELISAATVGAGADLGALGGPDGPAPVDPAAAAELAEDLSWAGDVAAFIRGSSVLGLGAGLIAETSDPAAAATSLERLRASLEGNGIADVSPVEGRVGFRVGVPGLPIGADVILDGDRVIAAGGSVSVDDLADPGSDDLGSAEGFQRATAALGDDFATNAYLNFADLRDLLTEIPEVRDDPGFQQAAEVLDKLDYLVVGERVDEDLASIRLVLGIREDGESGDTASTAVIAP